MYTWNKTNIPLCNLTGPRTLSSLYEKRKSSKPTFSGIRHFWYIYIFKGPTRLFMTIRVFSDARLRNTINKTFDTFGTFMTKLFKVRVPRWSGNFQSAHFCYNKSITNHFCWLCSEFIPEGKNNVQEQQKLIVCRAETCNGCAPSTHLRISISRDKQENTAILTPITDKSMYK